MATAAATIPTLLHSQLWNSGSAPAPAARGFGYREEEEMNQETRVIMRQGARELSEQELNTVAGATRHTTTKCTFDPATGHKDGDTGEC
jgi:hypothetical protein